MIRQHEFNETPQQIECAPGVVVVQMAVKKQGHLALVDDGKTCDQIGRVVAVGDRFEGIYLGKQVVSDPSLSLKPGDTVVCNSRGLSLDGFGWDVVSDTTIRVFGSNGGPGSFVPFQRYAFDEGIMAKIDEAGIKPIGKRVILKLGPVIGDVGGIILTDRSKKRDPVCEVLSVGPEVTTCKPGDSVVVSQNSVFEFVGEVKDLDIGSVYEDAILFKKGK